jgi:hypothetical protein
LYSETRRQGSQKDKPLRSSVTVHCSVRCTSIAVIDYSRNVHQDRPQPKHCRPLNVFTLSLPGGGGSQQLMSMSMHLRATYGRGLSFGRRSPAVVGVRRCSTRTNAIQIAGEKCYIVPDSLLCLRGGKGRAMSSCGLCSGVHVVVGLYCASCRELSLVPECQHLKSAGTGPMCLILKNILSDSFQCACRACSIRVRGGSCVLPKAPASTSEGASCKPGFQQAATCWVLMIVSVSDVNQGLLKLQTPQQKSACRRSQASSAA